MVKTFDDLWDNFVNFEALHAAYLRARRGKRYSDDVLAFGIDLEKNLLGLLSDLRHGRYRTGEYTVFHVYEPKKRVVAALPFRDRVVHHALVYELEKIYEPRFVYDGYACRPGKGTHAGADRVTSFLRRAHTMWEETYVLKADIRKYFPSVNRERLKQIIRRYVVCERTLGLVDEIIDSWQGDSGKGIPIGNLTSQLFANVYLHELDEHVKHDLRWKFYVRYMDDFVLFGPRKDELNRMRVEIKMFLRDHLLLSLNQKTSIFSEARGVDFLGYRIWRTHRLLRKGSVKRMRRKLKKYREMYSKGEVSIEQIEASIMSWLGHAKHADTHNLRKDLLGRFNLGGTR